MAANEAAVVASREVAPEALRAKPESVTTTAAMPKYETVQSRNKER